MKQTSERNLEEKKDTIHEPRGREPQTKRPRIDQEAPEHLQKGVSTATQWWFCRKSEDCADSHLATMGLSRNTSRRHGKEEAGLEHREGTCLQRPNSHTTLSDTTGMVGHYTTTHRQTQLPQRGPTTNKKSPRIHRESHWNTDNHQKSPFATIELATTPNLPIERNLQL